MKLRRFLLFLPAALSLLAAGCGRGSSEPTLATVGAEKITEKEFREAWLARPEKDRPDLSQPEKRREFLQDLVNKHLLEQQSIVQQPDLDEKQRRRMGMFAEGELISRFQRKHVDDRIGVTEEQIREVWNRMDREFKARHILTGSEAESREVAAALAGGASFEEEATRRSLDWQTGQNGGSLGWVAAGKMAEPFDLALFKLSPGQVSEPVKTRFGWHVIRADSVRFVPRPPYEQVRERINLGLMQQRSMVLQMELMKEVIDGAGPKYQPDAVAFIDRKFAVETPAGQANDPYAKFNETRVLPEFTPDELAMPVVKFTSKPDFTLRDFNKTLEAMAPGVWPRGGGAEEVEDVLRQMMRTKLYREAAQAEGIDKLPEYQEGLKKKEREMRVNMLYYRDIKGKIELTAADRHSFFEQHRQNYRIAERCQLARIQTADSSLALRVAGLWRAGRSFEDLEALAKQADPQVLTAARTMETPRGYEPPVDTLVFAGRPGDIVGPVRVPEVTTDQGARPGGWVVAQVLEIRPERLMTYEEAEPYLDNHARTVIADERLKKLLEEVQHKFPVRVNQPALDAMDPQAWLAAQEAPH